MTEEKFEPREIEDDTDAEDGVAIDADEVPDVREDRVEDDPSKTDEPPTEDNK